MKKLIELFKKIVNKETVLYVVFGLLTTVVSLVVYKLFCVILGTKLYLAANVISWVAAVAFAYVTNKLFVFESKSWAPKVLARELPSFIAARLFSLAVESLGLIFFMSLLRFDSKSFLIPVIDFNLSGEMLAKLILQVVVVILNYFFSKLVIFRKKKGSDK